MRLAALFALLLAAPAAAAPITRLCVFDSEQSRGWISPVIQIVHGPETGEVAVADSIILSHLDGAVRGEARAGRNGDITYRWLLTNLRDSGGHIASRLICRVTVSAPNGTAMGRMHPAGCGGAYSASGRCQRQG